MTKAHRKREAVWTAARSGWDSDMAWRLTDADSGVTKVASSGSSSCACSWYFSSCMHAHAYLLGAQTEFKNYSWVSLPHSHSMKTFSPLSS